MVPRRSRTGYSAVEAGATAFAVATGLKYVVGRARPTTGLGKKEFNWLTRDDAYASFPSRHTMAAWAIATPFALEYDMPWLYGVAALTNLSRIGSREHWVSDTVASSLIGYGIGLSWHAPPAAAAQWVMVVGASLAVGAVRTELAHLHLGDAAAGLLGRLRLFGGYGLAGAGITFASRILGNDGQ